MSCSGEAITAAEALRWATDEARARGRQVHLWRCVDSAGACWHVGPEPGAAAGCTPLGDVGTVSIDADGSLALVWWSCGPIERLPDPVPRPSRSRRHELLELHLGRVHELTGDPADLERWAGAQRARMSWLARQAPPGSALRRDLELARDLHADLQAELRADRKCQARRQAGGRP